MNTRGKKSHYLRSSKQRKENQTHNSNPDQVIIIPPFKMIDEVFMAKSQVKLPTLITDSQLRQKYVHLVISSEIVKTMPKGTITFVEKNPLSTAYSRLKKLLRSGE
jgi:hypothetical protein